MSGDHGKIEYDEVSAMKQFAIGVVPSSIIFMDHAGFSTYEAFIGQEIFKVKVILVTQEYHLYRRYISRSFGMDAYGVFGLAVLFTTTIL